MKNKKFHYVYRITDLKSNKHYVGVRSSHRFPTDDIGVIYFTSSKNKDFKTRFKNNPKQFKIKIVKIFNNRKDAIKLEIKYHNRLDVAKHSKFYNKINQQSVFSDNFKGKVAVAYKENPEKIFIVTSEEYQKNKNKYILACRRSIKTNGMKGKTHNKNVRKRLSKINKNFVVAFDIRTGEKVRITKEEFDNSKFYIGITKNTVTVFDLKENKYKRIPKELFKLFPERYQGVTKNKKLDKEKISKYKIKVREIKTGKTISITREEYRKNKDKYKSLYKNHVTIIDLETLESKNILREIFYKNKDRYVTARKKVICPVCKIEGKGFKFIKQHFKNCKKGEKNEF